jgi:hypothetical protein
VEPEWNQSPAMTAAQSPLCRGEGTELSYDDG